MPGHLARARGGLAALKQRLHNMRAKTEHEAEAVARTAEVTLASGAAGLLDGYLNSPTVAGLPVDLAIGGALRVGSIVMGGTSSKHLAAIGDGFISYFVGRKAYEMGLDAAADANDTDRAGLLVRRNSGQNDDGTPADTEDLIGHPGQ